MAVDLNMDMGEIIKGLLNKNGGAGKGSAGGIMDKVRPYMNSMILLVFTIAFVAGYFKYYYTPIEMANLKKMKDIQKLEQMKKETVELEQRIVGLKKTLSNSKEEYIESLSYFGNSEDLGELYQSVSTLAGKYDLVVMNIKEIPAPPPEPAKKRRKGEKAPPPVDPNKTKVKEIKVEVELKGKYGQYIQFKEDLAIAEMLLKVNTENIRVSTSKDERGQIFVKLNLSTYAIDKNKLNNAIGTPNQEAQNDE